MSFSTTQQPTVRVRKRARFVLARLVIVAAGTLASGCASDGARFDYAKLANPALSAYRVQAGDVIRLRIINNEPSSGNFTVRPDGQLNLPLGGEVRVSGLTMGQVKEAIVRRMGRYIRDAGEMISVSLEHVRGVCYSVIGEVNRAGRFESTSYVTVLEALANAGGLTVYAASNQLYVLRTDGEKQLRIPVDYRATVEDPSHNRNFYLLSGDIVVVP